MQQQARSLELTGSRANKWRPATPGFETSKQVALLTANEARVGYLKRTLGDGGAATLSGEGDPTPPRSPPPPPPPAPAPGEAGADLRRRSATPLTMFIAPDPALAAAAAAVATAHHRRGEDDGDGDGDATARRIRFESNPAQPDPQVSDRSGDGEIA